jgi:hypothetical protein
MSQTNKKAGKSAHWTGQDAKEFEKQADRFAKKVTASPKAARAYLEKLGTHTASGKLTKRYGG